MTVPAHEMKTAGTHRVSGLHAICSTDPPGWVPGWVDRHNSTPSADSGLANVTTSHHVTPATTRDRGARAELCLPRNVAHRASVAGGPHPAADAEGNAGVARPLDVAVRPGTSAADGKSPRCGHSAGPPSSHAGTSAGRDTRVAVMGRPPAAKEVRPTP